MSKAAKESFARKSKFSVSTVLIYLMLAFWALTTIYPIIWVIQNSFKAKDKILANSFSIPTGELFTLANYKKAFNNLNIFQSYKNSIFISTVVALAVIVLAGLASFALVRYSFKLSKALYSLVIAGMMFPVFATIIPVFTMEASWGITHTSSWGLTMLSVILPQIAGNLSFSIVVLTGFIRGLPIELEEAAYMEGCNPLQIFTKVVVPLAKPSLDRKSVV